MLRGAQPLTTGLEFESGDCEENQTEQQQKTLNLISVRLHSESPGVLPSFVTERCFFWVV